MAKNFFDLGLAEWQNTSFFAFDLAEWQHTSFFILGMPRGKKILSFILGIIFFLFVFQGSGVQLSRLNSGSKKL